jgi:L-histidine N-alpha-methyltransferase
VSPPLKNHARFRLTQVGSSARLSTFAEDVRSGLARPDKHLHCRYLYDAEGSRLFEAICALPEYYLLRAEAEIIQRHADRIIDRAYDHLRGGTAVPADHAASGTPAELELVELGSGSAEKTRDLIEALLQRQPSLRYVAIDVSQAALERSASQLLAAYPTLHVHALVGEYGDAVAALARESGAPRLVLWLGSSIGNLERPAAARFLARLGRNLGTRSALFVGFDLRKEASVLEPAYDDAQGVTARFNLNLLRRINAELNADFELSAFRHQAVYQEEAGRVAMYLVSELDQVVHIGALQLTVRLAAGERIHTEYSYKYAPFEIAELARSAGLELLERWTDEEERFVDVLLGGR